MSDTKPIPNCVLTIIRVYCEQVGARLEVVGPHPTHSDYSLCVIHKPNRDRPAPTLAGVCNFTPIPTDPMTDE